ncbi:CAMK family protein kinase [Tritrichomonas foetus]|uniref:CAMK family protein kinase n=1 Tax=Tritrichomonas foetus TaxID=1144522 RepID=A0A1J4JUI4_9EUKA|nr:CAMK family protein kinase [Tritrichomonas foetus]|eukprot:OHT01180.1 CAMK family protein kinase [Tritrichomonas foetus]
MYLSNHEAITKSYTIIQELPSGFLGPSVIVKHKASEEVRVCKICHKHFIGGPEQVESFKQHISRLNSLNLSFVVPYVDIIENESDLYIFRKYVEFGSLTDFVNFSSNMSNSDVKHIFGIVVKNFIQLHQNRIFPCSIKPSNIFIDSSESILITDLYVLTSDISWAMQTADPMQLAFLAPEFFDRSANPSSYSDIWSLGTLLFYLRSRTLPWPTKNVCMMIKNITMAHFTIPCFLEQSPEFDWIMNQCINRSAEARPIIEDLLNPKIIRKCKSRTGSVPLPYKLGQSAQMLIKPESRKASVFLHYGAMANSERRRKRQLSSGSISTSSYTIRCRFIRPDSDNND